MARPAEYRSCPLCALPLARGWHGARERLACQACGWVHWDNPTAVVAAVIEHDGQVLLARNAGWPAKMFGLVTGFLERDEEPAAAVAREVREETALDATAVDLIGVYGFAGMNQVIIAYHVVTRGSVQLSAELVEYRLLAPERVRPWRLATGLALADWLARRGLPVDFIDLPRQ